MVLSGRVWIDETYFEDTRVGREPGAPRKRGLSKDKVCVVVADRLVQAGDGRREREREALHEEDQQGPEGAHREGLDHRARLREGPQRARPRAGARGRALQGGHHRPGVPGADGSREPPVLVDSALRRALRLHEVGEPPGLRRLVRAPPPGPQGRGEVARRGKGGPPPGAVKQHVPAQMVTIHHLARRPL